MSTKTRVLLVDDAAEVADVYSRLLNRSADLECVGTRDTADELEAAIAALAPDVLVIDLTMPGRPPLEAIASVAARFPACCILAFSGHDDPQTRERVLDAGAWALVAKDYDPKRLLEEIRRIRGSSGAASGPA